jgi:hypothetical protein
MHPLGLAYYPDGAHGFGTHATVPELEHPTPEDCDTATFKCNPGTGVEQAPLVSAKTENRVICYTDTSIITNSYLNAGLFAIMPRLA